MKKTQALFASAAICAALSAVGAQSASAAPINLTLTSFAFQYTGSGPAPTYTTDNHSASTSNAGAVTAVDLPYTFHFSGEGSSLTPHDPLFIVNPQNTQSHQISSGVIQVTMGFLYNSTAFNLAENVNYYANLATDFDTLIWQAGSNGTCTGTTIHDSCTYAFTIAGQKFSIAVDNETDWNMAQFDAATVAVAPVPEPVTLTMFGAGLVGAGALYRRRKAKTAA